MKVANLWNSNSWLVESSRLASKALLLQTKAWNSSPLRVLLFHPLVAHIWYIISIANLNTNCYDFPKVQTFPQLLVQICHNRMQSKKYIIFKFNTNLLLLVRHFFIAYHKSIATSYHDITIIVTLTILNSISFPIILQS